MVFNFKVDAEFQTGIERLKARLGYEIGEGTLVTAEKGERIGVTLKDGKATIYYVKKVHFFRMLARLVAEAKKSDSFEIFEDTFFTELSTMIGAATGTPKLDAIFELLDYHAIMGYTMSMLYVECGFDLEGYPYFGYMRGRYTLDELKRVDDYAFEYGIEIIPCVECYGHMGQYLSFSEAMPIKDTGTVLLAREEKTFEFLDAMIKAASSVCRSKRINIGMDEAWDMGRGRFLDKHGYVKPVDIFNEFMDRLVGITNKYGLTPMMWCDMYFRVSNDHNGYYEENIEIPKEVSDRIPKEVELVFWHYGEKPKCDDYMLKKCNALGRKVIFAGANWSWCGAFPENHYTYEATKFSLEACRNNNVREAMLTIWGNAENDLFSNLYALSMFAELCYNENVTEEERNERFEACCGGSAEAFLLLSDYHNKFDEGEKYPIYARRFLGKHLFWQDIMEGLYDKWLFDRPMSEHYKKAYEGMKKFVGTRWEYLYRFAEDVFDFLYKKTYIAENLVPAYKSGDKAKLELIANKLLPELKEATLCVYEGHRAFWLDQYKEIGWSRFDVRYGGIMARCDTASHLINEYLSGRLERLDSLEEERRASPYSGFTPYNMIKAPFFL